jgi:uncharacterized protein YjiS (DUF1127 family)
MQHDRTERILRFDAPGDRGEVETDMEANMNAPLAKEQIALLMSDSLTYRVAPVQGTQRGAAESGRSSFARRISAAIRYVVELPRRRAVIGELSRLTDRELADIGLTRTGLRQVFSKVA